MLTLLALGLYSLSRGSYPLPASTLARALLAPQEMGEQPRFILFDIRLPRILMALLCGAMLGLAGAAMQSITRNGLADPGLIGVKEGQASWFWRWCCFPGGRPGLAAAGGDGRRHSGGPAGPDAGPRLFAAALYFNWHRRLLEPGGRGRHLYDHRRRTRRADGDDLAGGQPAGRHLAAAGGGFCWALPGAIILFCTARAADVALLGDRTAIGLGVRLQQLTVLRFCAGAADLGQRLLRRQPGFCGPDGAAYGAFRAARRRYRCCAAAR